IYTTIKQQGKIKDWILLMRDSAPAEKDLTFLLECVFNPGCVYRKNVKTGAGYQFFNVRASSLVQGGDLFDITAGYPERKVIKLVSNDPAHYELSAGQMFYRRVLKRVNWAQKQIGRKLEGVAASV